MIFISSRLNSTKLRVFAVAPVVGSTVVGAVTHQERRSAKRGSEGEQAENMTIARGGFYGIEFRCSFKGRRVSRQRQAEAWRQNGSPALRSAVTYRFGTRIAELVFSITKGRENLRTGEVMAARGGIPFNKLIRDLQNSALQPDAFVPLPRPNGCGPVSGVDSVAFPSRDREEAVTKCLRVNFASPSKGRNCELLIIQARNSELVFDVTRWRRSSWRRSTQAIMPGEHQPASAVLAAALLFALFAGCSQTPAQREEAHMKKGSQYLAGKDYRKAIIEFKVASQNMPKDAGPIYQLGMTYLSAGANRLAAEAFQKAIALDPKHEAAQYQLALFKAGASQPELLHEAKRVISAWTLSHPNDADAFASLGLVEAKLGNRAEAIRGLETGVAKDGSTIGIASAVISVYAARGDGDAGKEVARELAEKLPRSPEAAILHAEALLAAHDTAGADAEISRALGLKEDFRHALQLRLRRELATGDTSHAEQTTLALSRLPQKDLWGAYARQLFSENKIDQGMAEFEQALKQHNNDVSLRDEYAAALLRAGQSKEAEAVVAGTLKENPKAVPALMLRASIEIDSGRLDAASKDLRALRELKAFSARLSFLESHLFSARGETIRAADSLVEALKMDPGMFIARRELVRLLCLAGKGKNAVLVLDEAPAEQKHSAEFVLSRNLALLTAGDWDEARRSVDAALAVARMPGFLYQDAVLRLRKEDLAGARKSLEEAFRLAPSDTATIRMLGAIMRRQGEFPRFLEMVEDASRDNAATAPFQNELGSLLEGEGDRKGSRAVFEAAKSEGAVFRS